MRTDEESGPIRILDDIRDFLVHKEGELYESAYNLMRIAKKVELGDFSGYKNKDGEDIPEFFNAAITIISYKKLAAKERAELESGAKQYYDIG